MKISLIKDVFLDKLNLVSKFTSSRLATVSTLQGVLIEIKKENMHFYATDLNSYIHTILKIKNEEETKFVVDPKKLSEFLSFLSAASIDLEIKENQLIIKSGKTIGTFPLLNSNDFPPLPQFKEDKQPISKDILVNNLSLVLFAASSDETRPVLTGVNFVTSGEGVNLVATDGFRLSLLRVEKQIALPLPSLILPADFLDNLLRFLKTEAKNKKTTINFGYSKSEKVIVFQTEENEFYSRLIEGDFPQYEKVIPEGVKTKIKMSKEELLRNIKLASIFARDYSNIVIFDLRKTGLYITPRVDKTETTNTAYQEVEFEGEEQRIAFNFRFVLEFLNHIESDKIILEILRPDAPSIFKLEDNPNFLHLIMPVRIETT